MKKDLSEMTLEELWILFPIVLKEHSREYAAWYASEKERLSACLEPTKATRLSHIGSTAVKGLIAKPTVDILLELDDSADMDNVERILHQDGWILMQSQRESLNHVFNKGYTSEGFAERVFHLHVRRSGDWDELYFRDYLKDHHQAAREYGELKQGLAVKYRNDRDGYTEAKTGFIRHHTERARGIYRGRYGAAPEG